MRFHSQQKNAREDQAQDLTPMRIVEIELGQTLPLLTAFGEKEEKQYQRVLGVVRLHTHPLGIVELHLSEDSLAPSVYAPLIWKVLEKEINEHLQHDGLPAISTLSEEGMANPTTPSCLKEREQFLAEAPFVSVIIPTHERPDLLTKCLKSLLKQNYPAFEVVVVDNAPGTSTTADLIKQTYGDRPQIRYVREDRPGLSWAANRGIQEARGQILAFTDDDVILDTYWLAELVRAFRRADNVVCATGLVLPLELEHPAQFWFEQYGGFTKGFKRRIFDMANHRPPTLLHPYASGKFGTGASMAFKASYIRSVNGFDPALSGTDYVKAGPDIAAFFQVMIQNYQLVYEPLSLAYHLHRRDYPGLRKQIYNYGVGFTAYLTKSVWDRPQLLLDLLLKIPYGLFFAISNQSPKNQKRQANYPKELKYLELKGMLVGPFAYLQSRRFIQKSLKKDITFKES